MATLERIKKEKELIRVIKENHESAKNDINTLFLGHMVINYGLKDIVGNDTYLKIRNFFLNEKTPRLDLFVEACNAIEREDSFNKPKANILKAKGLPNSEISKFFTKLKSQEW